MSTESTTPPASKAKIDTLHILEIEVPTARSQVVKLPTRGRLLSVRPKMEPRSATLDVIMEPPPEPVFIFSWVVRLPKDQPVEWDDRQIVTVLAGTATNVEDDLILEPIGYTTTPKSDGSDVSVHFFEGVRDHLKAFDSLFGVRAHDVI